MRWCPIYLRGLEESRKFSFHRLREGERAKVLRILRDKLDRPEILLAVVHGGFLESEVFRDIDIAVFTGFKVPKEREEEFREELSDLLTKEVGIYVDLRLLDHAPPSFRVSSLSKCLILVERDPLIRISLLRASRQEIEDIRSKIRRLTKVSTAHDTKAR